MNNKKVIKVLGGVIIIIIIIISIILVNLKKINVKNITDSNNISQNDTQSNTENNEQDLTDEEKEENQKILKKLKKETEAERIQTYLGTYFKYIEREEYEKAYELLYPKFKENYFPSIEDFKKYIEELELPEMLKIDYDDVYTQGEYYVVTVKIGNFLDRAETEQEKTFILQENGYNDYYISIQM